VVCGQSGVGRITTSGTVSGFATSTGVGVRGIATGSDGALWFGEGNKIARITTSGALTEFALPTTSTGNLCGVAAGPDGAVWFTEQIGKIGRITTSETITEYPLPADAGYPFAITAGPDGAMWFTRMGAGNVSNGVIGRITTPASTASTSPLVAAVLPSSRVGRGRQYRNRLCHDHQQRLVDGERLRYRAGDFGARELCLPDDKPRDQCADRLAEYAGVDRGGRLAELRHCVHPNAPFVPTTVMLGFDCRRRRRGAEQTGLNTLLLSASATPVPDIVALAATAQNDGILQITGSNAFAVATVNVGASASITATATTGAAILPLTISLCQTNPMSGQCISSIGSSVTTVINANATPTFAIFAAGSGQVPFLPQTNRIFMQFGDANGIVRGSTSVAVETQ
jgi:hypothetical protein